MLFGVAETLNMNTCERHNLPSSIHTGCELIVLPSCTGPCCFRQREKTFGDHPPVEDVVAAAYSAASKSVIGEPPYSADARPFHSALWAVPSLSLCPWQMMRRGYLMTPP